MRKQKEASPCACCQRLVPLTFHHLIPRKMHRRKGFRRRFSKEELNVGVHICRKCHRGIHALYDGILFEDVSTPYEILSELQKRPLTSYDKSNLGEVDNAFQDH